MMTTNMSDIYIGHVYSHHQEIRRYSVCMYVCMYIYTVCWPG